MARIARAFRRGTLALAALTVLSCGGGSPPGTAPSGGGGGGGASANSVNVIVDAGPTPSEPTVNTLYTTITVCVPGSTAECQTIDHIQVDTQSYGLRILSPVLTLSLPVTKATDGNSLVECTQFVASYSWGPVALADVKISGEAAASVPVQVIGSPSFAAVPAACSGSGMAQDTVADFGANGILGIGPFEQDCGTGCTAAGGGSPAFYYACSQAACSPVAVPLVNQIQNVVPLFATDNNGTILDLPSVAAAGAASVTGTMIFGIDTQSNNASGTESVLLLDPDTGDFTAMLNGATYTESFIDSGSNGIFFMDAALSASSACPSPNTDFYCPSTAQSFQVTLQGTNGASIDESFVITNADTQFSNANLTALPDLGGKYTSSSGMPLDWGMPFFYGRRVATGIEGHTSKAATGPYTAF